MPKRSINECWLFLDCQAMTGLPPSRCPNRKACKQNALHTPNQTCELQYTYHPPNPRYDDELFFCRNAHLRVHANCPPEAIQLGWYPGEKLFYQYRDGKLVVGNPEGGLAIAIPPAAQALGFAVAEHTPYGFNSRPGYLFVTGYRPMEKYPTEFKEAGWYPAMDLPYYFNQTFDDVDLVVRKMTVSFDIHDSSYSDAIALGYHPACDTPINNADLLSECKNK